MFEFFSELDSCIILKWNCFRFEIEFNDGANNEIMVSAKLKETSKTCG